MSKTPDVAGSWRARYQPSQARALSMLTFRLKTPEDTRISPTLLRVCMCFLGHAPRLWRVETRLIRPNPNVRKPSSGGLVGRLRFCGLGDTLLIYWERERI